MKTQPLTALERELLGFVEQLATSSDTSAKTMTALDHRLTMQMTNMLDMLTECVTCLAQSQKQSTDALSLLMSESVNYAQVEQNLAQSMKQLQIVQKRLQRS